MVATAYNNNILTLSQHISSYPIVNDGVTKFKENPYGAKAIEVTNTGYAKFVKPALPYLEKPAAYAKPYAAKADELGDKLLTAADEKAPAVKNTVGDFVAWPLIKTVETRDWLMEIYSNEYKNCGGDGYVASGKAAITTQLVVGAELLHWMSRFLQRKQEQAKEAVAEKTNN